jgi:hypothetical protein
MGTGCLYWLLSLASALAWSESKVEPKVRIEDMIGRWMYTGFIHDGKRYERPNPDLMLFFSFNEAGQHQLYWTRRGQNGFCERRGPYRLDNDMLWQKVTWLNPQNDFSCGHDPDMQLDKETVNPVSLNDQELGLHMDLNGKEFIYLLQKIPLKPEKKSLTIP